MVKPPKARHSKTRSNPVTIDLDPKDVSRSQTAEEPKPDDAAAEDKSTAEAAAAAAVAAAQAPDADAAAKQTGPQTKSSPMEGAFASGRAAPGTAEAKSGAPDPARTAELSKAASSTPPKQRTVGGASLLAAGVAGGVVALALAAGLQYAGLFPTFGGGSGSAAVAALQTQIGSLERQIAEREGAGAAGADAAVNEINARLDTLGGKLNELESSLSSLEAAGQTPGADAAAVAALGSRLDDVEKQLATPGDDQGVAAEALQSLEQRLTTLEGAVQNAADAAEAARALAEQQSGRTSEQGDRLTQLDTRIGEFSARLDEQANSPRLAAAIAASALKSAIDRGEPFAGELETFAAVAPGASEIAALRDLAAKGVPTREAIAQEAGEAATAIIRSTRSADPEAGFVERLYSSAQSLVNVRPVGEVEGDSVPAIAARMEAAIKAGDYGKAIAEYETLPESAKAAGAAFIDKVRARMTADELVNTTLAGALKS